MAVFAEQEPHRCADDDQGCLGGFVTVAGDSTIQVIAMSSTSASAP